jgi:anti-sigma-K factor RskA
MNLSRPDRSARLDALAAQYALGTLAPGARRRLATIARTEPAVGAAMREWEWRLASLAEAVPGIAPAPRVWAGIARRLGLETAAAGRPAPTSWWASLSLWRGLALAGFALAFALGVTLLAPVRERLDEPIVVLLAGQDAKPVLLVSADRGGRFLTVKAVAPMNVPADRSLELWALPEGRNPRSLGLVPATGIARLPLPAPAGAALPGTPALAVSLEPAGGSPTGAPTGPVLYTGGVQTLY